MSAAPTPEQFLDALHRLDLIPRGAGVVVTPLTGGVSSDIWRVDLGGPQVLRQARAAAAQGRRRLAGAGRAQRATRRTGSRIAREIVPGAVPRLLGARSRGRPVRDVLLDPAALSGLEAGAARRPGRRLPPPARSARSSAASMPPPPAEPSIAAAFDTTTSSTPSGSSPTCWPPRARIPTARRRWRRWSERTAPTKLALVHGDVSPKNILVGPDGPVFLDAECAWYGDPAFDLAFCLNHLLLKCAVAAAQCGAGILRLLRCAWREAYLAGVTWEPRDELEARAARTAAGAVPGAHRRQVAGRVRHRRRRSRSGCAVARAAILAPPCGSAGRRCWRDRWAAGDRAR